MLAGTGLRGMVGARAVELGGRHAWHLLGCDITDATAVDRAVGDSPSEVIVHFAAFTATDEAWAQRGDRTGACYRTNVDGTRNIAEACRRHGRYLIHVSTDYVFSGERAEPYRESDEPDPVDWYGKTKYWGECEVRAACGEFTILRPSFPFRARYRRKADLVRKIIGGLAARRIPPMFCDTLVTPTFADEFATVVDRVAEIRPRQGLFHCAGATSLSPYDLARVVAREFGFDESVVSRGYLADYLAKQERPYARYLNMSSERAGRRLGVRFSPIETALRAMRAQWRGKLEVGM